LFDNKRYIRVEREHNGFAPPEARLPPTIVGSIALPIGLFWFAWTNSPSIHWLASIAAGVPFGFGMVLVFLSLMNYLIDAYTIFAASVLAASAVLRSLFGAAFPLFTRYMYDDLGIHWASSIPAFLALACVPFPFLFYKYGARIRAKCAFAAHSAEFMRKLHAAAAVAEEQDETAHPSEDGGESERSRPSSRGSERTLSPSMEAAEARRMSRARSRASVASLERRQTRQSFTYDGNPYNIDRVNTHESDFHMHSPHSREGHAHHESRKSLS
jgi:hypothetical protein